MTGKLILSDNTTLKGLSFGAAVAKAGEVVFATGMTGYPESLTDPSYKGQILVLTYPLIGNYGVPAEHLWESDHIQVAGLIVSSYNPTPSHFQSKQTLSQWFKKEKIPLLEIKDTRALTQQIRTHGVMLGKITFAKDIPFYNPNNDNLVATVSTKKITFQTTNKPQAKTILLLDCGAKRNIQQELLKRDVNVLTGPWNTDIFSLKQPFDALLISNGPGDPKMAKDAIKTISKALKQNIPTLGICMGNQLLALAAGGDTYKLKFGHRSQNQPCLLKGSNRCYITTQNHGFAVGKLPHDFHPWFVNANDQSIEGIIHNKKPFMSVQFHPEAAPGPMDTAWIFDHFLKNIKGGENNAT